LDLKPVLKPKQIVNSFASHEKAKFWSSLNDLKPEEIHLNSHKKFWFDCPKCNHSYESILNNINTNDSGCPYCYNRKLCGKEECILCFEKSFASNEKAKFWSSKNNISPLEVSKGTEKKYVFDCNNCGHELFISLKGITDKNRWCCYCSHQELCDNEICNFCFNNSFASSNYAKYWNQTMNKDVKPRKTFKNTNKKYFFDCHECENIFEKTISDITSKKTWCPICKNKTERKLFKELGKKYHDIQREYKAYWCKNVKHLPFDFVLENQKIIIELDGPHHFEQVSNWGNYDENQKRDLFKMKCANDNGFSVIRLLQEDVFYDKYDWFTELTNHIEKITNEKKVQNIYICKKDEYKNFVIEK
jgi:very-short-patch-repair endonuclease